ncbi:MAG: DUF1801 domain-containing protein [Gammaproteobacteria bacterium]|nr:DUF1801 domain-containing protein [Gammaproteobacteria bacterium]
MSADRVTKLLEDIRLLSEDRYKLVQSLRKLILGLEGVSEEVKYGGILFAAGKPFCGIFSYANHVSLEFSAGASLPDKHKVLEGDGKLRRHIKLTAVQDIEGKHVRDYVVLARNCISPPLQKGGGI